MDFNGTAEAFRPTFTWGSENYLRAPKVVYETLQAIFELDVKLFYIYSEATYRKRAPVDSRYMTEQDWKEHTFLFVYGGHNRRKPKRGYSFRWLRLKTKAEDLMSRREALKSNLLFLMLTHNDRYVEDGLEDSMMRMPTWCRRIIANEVRNTKQQQMVEDIWNAMKAKGDIGERVEKMGKPEKENQEDRAGSASLKKVEDDRDNDSDWRYTETYQGLHPQLQRVTPKSELANDP